MAEKNVKKIVLNLILILLGCAIVGFAYNIFNAENGIVLPGLSGLCIIISNYIELWFNVYIPFTIFYVIINIVLLAFSYKYMGKSFVLYTIYGILCYTLFVELGVYVQGIGIPTNDLLLCAIFGGILIGFGVGLVIRRGGATGGSDILACLINAKSTNISIGTVNIIINAIVIGLIMISDGMSLALYGLINICLAGFVTDYVIQGSIGVNAYYIISNKNKEISQAIIGKMNKSVTAFHSKSLSTDEEVDVLCVVLHTSEINMLKNIIYDTDSGAFVYATRIREAMNKGFSKLEDGADIITKIKRKRKRMLEKKRQKRLEKEKKKTEIESEEKENENSRSEKEGVNKK